MIRANASTLAGPVADGRVMLQLILHGRELEAVKIRLEALIRPYDWISAIWPFKSLSAQGAFALLSPLSKDVTLHTGQCGDIVGWICQALNLYT